MRETSCIYPAVLRVPHWRFDAAACVPTGNGEIDRTLSMHFQRHKCVAKLMPEECAPNGLYWCLFHEVVSRDDNEEMRCVYNR